MKRKLSWELLRIYLNALIEFTAHGGRELRNTVYEREKLTEHAVHTEPDNKKTAAGCSRPPRS